MQIQGPGGRPTWDTYVRGQVCYCGGAKGDGKYRVATWSAGTPQLCRHNIPIWISRVDNAERLTLYMSCKFGDFNPWLIFGCHRIHSGCITVLVSYFPNKVTFCYPDIECEAQKRQLTATNTNSVWPPNILAMAIKSWKGISFEEQTTLECICMNVYQCFLPLDGAANSIICYLNFIAWLIRPANGLSSGGCSATQRTASTRGSPWLGCRFHVAHLHASTSKH